MSKLFGKLIGVAVRGFAPVLFALAAASLSTAAYAVKIEIFVNGASTATVDTTLLNQPVPDATGPATSGAIEIFIPTGYYPQSCTPGNNCLLHIAGPSTSTQFSAKASVVLSGGTTISTSSSVLTKLNTQGVITYLGQGITPPTNGGRVVLVTSNKFVLPSGVWSTAMTGSLNSRGASRCTRLTATGAYGASSSCTVNNTSLSNIGAGSCAFCRVYEATDQGDVYRGTGTTPAAGVRATLRSEVRFFDTNGNEVRKELIGGGSAGVPLNPPSTTGGAPFVDLTSTNSHFYLLTVKSGPEWIPCEPLTTSNPPASSGGAAFTCANNERKINTLTFEGLTPGTGLKPGDRIDMPTTSTDLSASDQATADILTDAKFLIDVQPLGVVVNTDPETQAAVPLLPAPPSQGGSGNDWNPAKLSGKRQVLLLNTYNPDTGEPRIDACNNISTGDVTLTVAGSDPAPAESSEQALLNGTCIGRTFFFNYGDVNSTIPGVDPLASCEANPRATLTASGVTLTATYPVSSEGKLTGKPIPYQPPDAENCTYNAQTQEVTCTLATEPAGTVLIRCCTSCG